MLPRSIRWSVAAIALFYALTQGERAASEPSASPAVVADAMRWMRAVDSIEREPAVAPDNVRGYGALAIRQGRDLYIVDGDASRAKSFRRIERGATVRAMRWSYDGRWLAYATDDALWLIGRTAATPRRLPVSVAAGDRFDWSPRADVLWVGTGALRPCQSPESSTRRTVFEPGTVAIVTPSGRTRRLPSLAVPSAIRWSTPGRTIAAYAFAGNLPYITWPTARQALFTARPLAHMHLDRARLRVASNAGGQVAFAQFVPDSDDILYWHGPEISASAAADGQELWLQTAPGSAARNVGFMLENRAWISFSADARRFVFVQGSGREAWHTKSLVVCDRASTRCSPLPQPPATISLDPQWTPHGSRIAFVRARDIGSDGGYGHHPFIENWVARRTLWLQNADGTNARQLERFGSGIYWPRWSRDGRRILVYRNGAIWLGAFGKVAPKRIVSGLVRPSEFDGGYFAQDHGEVGDDEDPVAWTGG